MSLGVIVPEVHRYNVSYARNTASIVIVHNGRPLTSPIVSSSCITISSTSYELRDTFHANRTNKTLQQITAWMQGFYERRYM